MSLKRKLLGLGALATVAAVSVVVMSASASNREGHWATPGHTSTTVHGLEKPSHTVEFAIEGAGKGVVCEATLWDTAMTAETEKELTFIPVYDKCKTTGGTVGEVKIKGNGCSLELYVAKGTTENTEQTADFICGVGTSMEVSELFCTLTITTQKNLTGITYKNITLTKEAVTVSFNTKLVIKADGACPMGTGTAGKLSGALTIEAYDDAKKEIAPIKVVG
ncbi:MAG TPA: hypothetical protein VN732_09755 [Solirubrobacterales bacterium]|nr:hypothetical protein [Solirubrobacterales bacterium]